MKELFMFNIVQWPIMAMVVIGYLLIKKSEIHTMEMKCWNVELL